MPPLLEITPALGETADVPHCAELDTVFNGRFRVLRTLQVFQKGRGRGEM